MTPDRPAGATRHRKHGPAPRPHRLSVSRFRFPLFPRPLCPAPGRFISAADGPEKTFPPARTTQTGPVSGRRQILPENTGHPVYKIPPLSLHSGPIRAFSRHFAPTPLRQFVKTVSSMLLFSRQLKYPLEGVVCTSHCGCVTSQHPGHPVWLVLMNETHVWFLPCLGLFHFNHPEKDFR